MRYKLETCVGMQPINSFDKRRDFLQEYDKSYPARKVLK
jgi:hypothetical protein